MIPPKEFCDFEKEPGKLWFRSPMIMNGVCCTCIGYLNLTKLDGTARLEFDAEYARVSVQNYVKNINLKGDFYFFKSGCVI